MLTKIYNFSHPMTAEQLTNIADRYHLSTGDIEVIAISAQLDLDEALLPQVSDIADQVRFATGEDVYVVLPPDRANAAVILVDLLQSRGAKVNVVRFSEGAQTFKEIISLANYLIV